MCDLCLKLSYRCNNNCLCCPEFKKGEELPFSTREIIGMVSGNINRVIITGGEPTLNKDFFPILDKIKKKYPKMKFCLMSNGRIFAYKKFIDRIAGYNLEHIVISIYAFSEKRHEAITSAKKSFHETISGINNLMRHGQRVTVCLPLSRMNYRNLVKQAKKFLAHFETGKPHFEFRLIDLIADAEKNRKILNVKFTEMWPHLKPVLEYFISQNVIFHLFQMMPFCLIPPEFHKHIMKKREKELVADIKKNLVEPYREFTYLENICLACEHVNRCHGIYSHYLKYNGDKEFKKQN